MSTTAKTQLEKIAREFLSDFGHRFQMHELVDNPVKFHELPAKAELTVKMDKPIKVVPRGQMRALVESMEVELTVSKTVHGEHSATVRLSYDHGDGTNGKATSYRLIVEKDMDGQVEYRHFVKYRHYVMLITEHNQKLETLKTKN